MKQRYHRGSANVWLIMTIVLAITTITAAGFLIWALMNYIDQKDNVDSKVAVAVADAEKAQADKLEADFVQRDKQPNRKFVGPDDYGRLSFDYPKTWSVYVQEDAARGGQFKAYLNPVSVPPVTQSAQLGLRVTIETRAYETVLQSYQSLIRTGDLKSSTVSADGETGTRLDGSFSKDIRGSAVLFKIRDKTVTLRTDADTFKGDFDAMIASVTFNK